MSLKRRNLLPCLLLGQLLFCYSPIAATDPWINAGDEQTRHHLQVLVDGGLINIPITSWPVTWSSVGNALDSLEPKSLTTAQVWSYHYLRHELRKAMTPFAFTQKNYASSSVTGLSDFGTDHREQYEASFSGRYTGNWFAGKAQMVYAKDALDGQDFRADGSYAAALLGNWALGIGALDRWWGPGWQASMVLSHNARPTPGLFLQRSNAEAFEWPVLKILGPWQLTTFMNQLESDRHISKAKLWGMRLNFRPLRSLEIGLSRTAMWGGEGRPQDWETFADVLLGNDNTGERGISKDGSNEPGNQMAGVDWRWGFNTGRLSSAFYGQIIGEDEKRMLPIQEIGLFGLETSFASDSIQTRLAVELNNSTVQLLALGTGRSNVAYEHHIYGSGYRYRGRPLGASTDNDSRAVSLRGGHYFSNGHQFSWQIINAEINRDNADKPGEAPPGGNVFGTDAGNIQFGSMTYQLPLSPSVQLEMGLTYYSDPLVLADKEIDSGAHIALLSYW